MEVTSLIIFHRSLRWRHNGREGVPNHQPHDCLHNRVFRHISKATSKLRVTGLCEGGSPATGKFPAQKASNAKMSPFDDVIMFLSYIINKSQCKLHQSRKVKVLNNCIIEWFGHRSSYVITKVSYIKVAYCKRYGVGITKWFHHRQLVTLLQPQYKRNQSRVATM